MGTEAPTGDRGAGRWLAAGGVLGPAAFVAGWIAAGSSAPDYSAVDQAISRLAAVGASTAPLMTTGFVAFGVGMVLYGQAIRRRIRGGAWVAATVSGLATLGVAATPLDHSSTVDAAHAAFAGVGYVAISATPLLAAGPLGRLGARWLARLGTMAGLVSAAALLLTLTGAPTGALQRLGLTTADVWIAGSAATILAGRLPPLDGQPTSRR